MQAVADRGTTVGGREREDDIKSRGQTDGSVFLKILVVDDEKIIREGIADMLKGADFIEKVALAEDGFAALEYLNQNRIDAVITDILMPEMDGLEFIGRARKEELCEDFLILSGYAEFSYAQQAISYGVSKYLLKPVDQEELLAALAELNGRREPQERDERQTGERLAEKIREGNAPEGEMVRLVKEVLRLPGRRYPQSQKVRLLFELILTCPEAEERVAWALGRKAFVPGEAAAMALCDAMRYFMRRKERSASAVQVLLYTMRNYEKQEISLTYVAGAVFMNANYLSGLVSRSIGISFNTFVRLLRVSRAQELLKKEGASVQQVGLQCGFGNMNMFFRTFRDIAGVTPMNYKKEGI